MGCFKSFQEPDRRRLHVPGAAPSLRECEYVEGFGHRCRPTGLQCSAAERLRALVALNIEIMLDESQYSSLDKCYSCTQFNNDSR